MKTDNDKGLVTIATIALGLVLLLVLSVIITGGSIASTRDDELRAGAKYPTYCGCRCSELMKGVSYD